MSSAVAAAALTAGGALGASAISANAQKRAMQQAQKMAPPTLTLGEATDQARDVLNPLYDQQLQDNLKQVDRHNLQRGFYGQMPGDALARSTAAEIERSRAGQIASLAQQMQGQSQQQALQQQQLAMQYALGKGDQRQNMWSNLLGAGTNLLGVYTGITGQLPWQKSVVQESGLGGPFGNMSQKEFMDWARGTDWETIASLLPNLFPGNSVRPLDATGGDLSQSWINRGN